MGFAVAGGIALAGMIGASSAQNAANSQSQAADRANQQASNQFDKQQAAAAPYVQSGYGALNQLNNQMPDLTRQFTMQDFHQDPGYQFNLNQGIQAMQRSAAAKGMLNSTGTMQGLNNYAQGMASNEYSNAYNRFTQSQEQRYNMLSGIAGMGNVANGQMAQVGINTSNNMNSNTIGQGNAMSAGQMAQGNNLGNMVGNGVNSYMNYNLMNRIYGGQNNGMPAPNYGAGAGMEYGSVGGGANAGTDSSLYSNIA